MNTLKHYRIPVCREVGDKTGLIPCQDAVHDDFSRSEVRFSDPVHVNAPRKAEL